MKTRYSILKAKLALVLWLSLLASCSDFTDIRPKGKSLLTSTNDLELLLNQNMELVTRDLGYVGGDFIYSYSDVRPDFLLENKSRSTLLFGFFDNEASIRRIELLTTSDNYYTTCYSWIGKMANPILQQLEAASGETSKKTQLKSEALAWRAFGHYLILQKYAKAYHPQTAATDPGVIYLTDSVDINVNQKKKSVKACYELALNDINEAIRLDGVPLTPTNKQRLSKAAVYAVKAHICMAMRDYGEAEAAAKEALRLNGTLYDYWAHAETKTNNYGGAYQVAVVTSMNNPEVYMAFPEYISYYWIPPEVSADIEAGYSRWYLYYKSSDSNLGKPDDGKPTAAENAGLPGWDGAFLDVSAYDNTSGLTASFMYLYVAECEIRSGNVDAGMDYLDALRKNRLPADAYRPLKGRVTTRVEAIRKLQQTSFAELVWTGWNFMQRKRWNLESEWAKTLSRTIAGVTYTLEPTSDLWVFPFPQPAREVNPNLISNHNR